jgi:signal transduction histidine kinase
VQESALRSVSRELHDEFGQVLTAVGAIFQRTEKRLSADAILLRADLREVQEIVQSALDKVRALSRALHPVMLEEIGFESAVSQYLPGFQRQTGIPVRYEQDGSAKELDRSIAIHLYRVMQEALNNIARHSKATQAALRLHFLPEAVVLEVEDDGVGFQGRKPSGMGLVSMKERAELMNGDIEFLPGTGGGALVRLTVPAIRKEAHV